MRLPAPDVTQHWGNHMPVGSIASPLGPLYVTVEDQAITRLSWLGEGEDDHPLIIQAAEQLDGYFGRELIEFDLPLAPKATQSQKRFLDALLAIPYGETKTYGQISKELGISAQAAGQACGANPIAILIPCHRVIGTGHLGGFSAPDGIETKVELLKLEGAASLLI